MVMQMAPDLLNFYFDYIGLLLTLAGMGEEGMSVGIRDIFTHLFS